MLPHPIERLYILFKMTLDLIRNKKNIIVLLAAQKYSLLSLAIGRYGLVVSQNNHKKRVTRSIFCFAAFAWRTVSRSRSMLQTTLYILYIHTCIILCVHVDSVHGSKNKSPTVKTARIRIGIYILYVFMYAYINAYCLLIGFWKKI